MLIYPRWFQLVGGGGSESTLVVMKPFIARGWASTGRPSTESSWRIRCCLIITGRLSFPFISHDMAVVERISHHVAVMYLGRILEIGPRAAIFEDPRHPYTKSLLGAVPIADPSRRRPYDDSSFRPVPSPIFPVRYTPEPSRYEELAPNHLVLKTV